MRLDDVDNQIALLIAKVNQTFNQQITQQELRRNNLIVIKPQNYLYTILNSIKITPPKIGLRQQYLFIY